jgi:hypothetical protein
MDICRVYVWLTVWVSVNGIYNVRNLYSGFTLEECSHHAAICCSAIVLTVVFTNMENYIEESSEQSELFLNNYKNFVSFVKVTSPW